jgi:DNA (cytosine-5)-methyltransferase 1
MESTKIRFIDLFAGLGGIRLGFENVFNSNGYDTECVMTSEIKPY